jgi:hypothetical protein
MRAWEPTTSLAASTTAALTFPWPPAATSATPARGSASSRLVARSSSRTRPAMRATTSRKSTAEAPITTSTSTLPMSCAKWMLGATRHANASSARRSRVRRVRVSAAASSSVRMDG